jgi:uncharacterized membrane protein YdjX (TVP38/TMEM64 family)
VDAVSEARPAGPDRTPDHARTPGRLALLALGLAAVGLLAWGLGLHDWVRPERFSQLRAAIEGHGAWGPVLFVTGYVLGELLFVPALPLTLLGGLVFGPVRGILYVWLAATLSAALAFLVARHLARDTVERWMASRPRFARIDHAVERHGWRIVMVTRLVPLFPFNLQNYAYGLTRIDFWTYLLVSAVSMLPGTIAFTLAGGAFSGGGRPARTVWTLAVAGVLIVLVSLAPRWLARRSGVARELLGPDRRTPVP